MKHYASLLSSAVILIALLSVACCSIQEWTIVPAVFDEEYTTGHFNSLFVYDNYSGTGCSLKVSMNVTFGKDNLATFKIIQMESPHTFDNIMPKGYLAFGSFVFQMKKPEQVDVLFGFDCPRGILNVRPSTMDIFVGKHEIIPTNSQLSSPNGSIECITSTNVTKLNLALGARYSILKVESKNPLLFYGPQQFYHVQSQHEDFRITLPNVEPSFSNYTFKAEDVNSKYQNYTTLFSYKFSTTNSPNMIGLTTKYYTYEQRYVNNYGNDIDIIPDSIKCISSNGIETEESVPTYIHELFEDSIVCNSPPSSTFVAAIATINATELKVGESYSTGPISSITYRFMVPSNKTLVISDIALDDSDVALGYIVFNLDSRSGTKSTIESGGAKDQSFTNQERAPIVVYVQFG